MTSDESIKEKIHHIATHCLSVRLRLLNRMANTIYDRALKPYNIKASQVNILVAVAYSSKKTSRELCDMLQMDKSTFSRTLTRLSNNNWLKTDPSGDGKILRVTITQDGLEKIDEIYVAWQQAQKDVAALFGKSATGAILESGTKQLQS